MTTINDGGPAFPARVSVNRDSGELQPFQFGNDDFCTSGLSLRDFFAAKAMCSAMDLSPTKWWNEGLFPAGGTVEIQRVANVAYAMADAMLAARGAQ